MKHKKDVYYFPHDSNANSDPKCVLLIEQLGMEGYGIFWVLVETLREQPDFKYPLRLISSLARRYNTTTEKMKAVVMSYELFNVDEGSFFFSDSLNRRMQFYLDKKKSLSEAGKKGNQIRWRSKNIAQRSGGDQVAIANKSNQNKTKDTLLFEGIEEENLLEKEFPNDGVNRNFVGLKNRIDELKISIRVSNLLIVLSNYGEIGNAVWKVLDNIRDRKGSYIKNINAYTLKCLKEYFDIEFD